MLDLAVLLLASNALQNALIGNDNSVTGGVIGAGTLFVANYLFVRLTFRSMRARRILEGTPTCPAPERRAGQQEHGPGGHQHG